MPASQAQLRAPMTMSWPTARPSAWVIDQHAHHHPQQAAGQHRRRHHQALLRLGEVERGGDLHRQRSEHHPDHEGDVEVEKRGQQRRCVAGLPESFVHAVLQKNLVVVSRSPPPAHAKGGKR
jgi:hypothetical protein